MFATDKRISYSYHMSRRCRKCLLPEQVPDANLDSNRVCRPCREYAPEDRAKAEKKRLANEVDLEKTLKECRNVGEYDCLLSFSGGKDSVYLLYKLVREYHLRVLAYTLDFDLPSIAWDNINRTIKALDVDHFVYRPNVEFYRQLTRFLLKNQASGGAVITVGYVWAPLRDSYVLRLATDKQIPLVLLGYSPGQPDPYNLNYEMPRELIYNADWRPQNLIQSGLFDARNLAPFWNPRDYPKGTQFPRFLAPLHAWKYNQEALIREVVKFGLVKTRKNANPMYSNFPMNWLFMYSDLKNLGFIAYEPEFAKLIREGKASFQYWKIMARVGTFMVRHQVFLGAQTKKYLKWFDLRPEDLRITHEAGNGFPFRKLTDEN